MPATPTETAGAAAPPESLVRALRRLLRPLVRLLLTHQITYPFLSNLLKSVYVETATREFTLEDKRQTDSRISLLTGVHRKDVKRFRREKPQEQTAPPAVSLGAHLVATWTGSPQYLDESGHPRPLPRLSREGGVLSFEGLVESVSRDIRSRAVLDEWLRLGVARLDDEDRVCLNVDAFVPKAGFDEKAYYFGRNLHDHLAAGAHNLMGREPPFVERSVYYGALGEDSVGELAELSERVGMEALQTVNRRARVLQRRDEGERSGKLRMNFGIYFFKDSSSPDDEEGDDA